MSELYVLTNGAEYQKIEAVNPDKQFVENWSMYGFGDAFSFYKNNGDGSKYGSHWSLHNLGCFAEFRGCSDRIVFLNEDMLSNLALRVHECLFSAKTNYKQIPTTSLHNRNYSKILEELCEIKSIQKEGLAEGSIIFPSISDREMSSIASW